MGLDSIKFVAGLDGVEKAKCLLGWKGLTCAAATLLGMTASIVPVVYNHFSPQDRLKPQHQAIGIYAASSLMFLSYWLGTRVKDGFDMAVPEDPDGMYNSYRDDTYSIYGGSIMALDKMGVAVFGSRKISSELHLTGAAIEGVRPAIIIGDGDIRMAAEEGYLRRDTFLLSKILMRPGSVHIEGGHSDATASAALDINTIQLNRNQRMIIIDDQSIRLGTNTGKPINPAIPEQCMVMITDNAVEATGEAIRLQANGSGATFDERGAAIGSRNDYLRAEDGRGVEINGKRLSFDAHTYVHWG